MKAKNLCNESLKAIQEKLGVQKHIAADIKKLAAGWSVSADSAIESINTMLEGYGTEVIRCNDWINSYWQDIAYQYVNMGDCYINTVVYGVRERKFFISDIASIVEGNPEGYII